MSWRRIYLGTSALLVGATVVYFYLPDFPQKYRVLGPFCLGMENNLAVWWSGASLFFAALLAYELSCSKDSMRYAWSALAFVFLGLASDELGSLHERLGRWREYARISVLLLPLLGFALYALTRDPRSRRSVRGIVLGFGAFGLVAGLEWLESVRAVKGVVREGEFVWSTALESLRIGVEEGLELLGMFLILQALVLQRTVEAPEQRLRVVVPRPEQMRHLIPLLVLGLAAHVGVCTWVVPEIHDDRGNLAALFATFAYLLLFAAAFWRHLEGPPLRRGAWRALAILMVVLSAGQQYDLSRLVPRVTAVIPEWALSDAYVVTAVQLALVLLFWRGRRDMLADRPRILHVLGAVLLVAGLLLAGHDPGLAVLGAFPYLLAVFFL